MQLFSCLKKSVNGNMKGVRGGGLGLGGVYACRISGNLIVINLSICCPYIINEVLGCYRSVSHVVVI